MINKIDLMVGENRRPSPVGVSLGTGKAYVFSLGIATKWDLYMAVWGLSHPLKGQVRTSRWILKLNADFAHEQEEDTGHHVF